MHSRAGLFSPCATFASGRISGTGWLPPIPDLRDYTSSSVQVAPMLKQLKLPTGGNGKKLTLPRSVDLREGCSPPEHQGKLGSCTAHAAAGIVEYFERRAFGKHVEASRLFLYKATRNLMQVTGDTGGRLRTTMAALRFFGVPPEKYWPYTDTSPDFDEEPSAFVYQLADDYAAISYLCHDPLGGNVPATQVLAGVKTYLAAGVPAMFGFWGFPSVEDCDVKGGIPFPGPEEQAQWGHAIGAFGYDDAKKIRNTRSKKTTVGALLIRNSWGADWGDGGYGWLPYDYVTNRLAIDFWSLLKLDWVETKQFGL